MWQEARKLVGHDLRRARWNYLLTMMMSLLFGAYTALMLRSLAGEFTLDRYLLDFYFLAVVPVIGCPWYTGKYTERTRQQLKFYRTLPISAGGVVLSRTLLVLLRAVPNGILLFGGLYLFSPELRALMTPVDYLWFALIWFGYGVALSCWYPYWELNSGSIAKFFLYTWWYVVIWAVLSLVSWLGFDLHVLPTVVEWAKTHGYLYAIASIALGGLAAVYWWRLAKLNLESKTLY